MENESTITESENVEQQEPEKSKDNRKFKFKAKFFILIGTFIVLSLLIFTVLLFKNRNEKQISLNIIDNSQQMLEQEVSDNLPAEKDANNFNMKCEKLGIEFENPKDIYSSKNVKIICVNGVKEEVALELHDMYTNHHHSYELVAGNIYLIRRIGYDGHPDDEWVDELWGYYKDDNSKKIASSKGLDFRVSTTGNNIVVDTHNNQFLVINVRENTQSEVDVTKYFSNSTNRIDIEGIKDDYVWLAQKIIGPHVTAFMEIILKDNSVKSYSLPEEIAGFSEYSLNLDRGLVAYTNYPAFFDVSSAKEFEESNTQISLNVYDLKEQKTTFIDSGIKTKFAPKWIDKTTLEYKNPNGEGNLQKSL